MESIRNFSSTIKFRDICKIFENLRNHRKVDRKETILQRYYESFCKHRQNFRESQGIAADEEDTGDTSFYPVLRLLLPGTDTARASYGLQITVLGRLYIRVLQLPQDSPDAERLKHRSYSTFRDYADVVYAVLQPRCFNSPSDFTLKEIHEMLDIFATEDITVKERTLIQFTNKASPMEQKWMVRLLLKAMGLGISEQRVFAVLSPYAQDTYTRCSDLKRVCILLANNKLCATLESEDNIKNFNVNSVIEPFHQIRPMLCERFPGKIEDLMESDVLYLETKMDGERFQLHYANGRFKFISRNGADYTDSFGDSFERGSLTQHLRPLLPSEMQSIILDGEMMVWNTEEKRFHDKGENTDVKHLNENRAWRPCFVIYDLLYFNGQSLLDMTYVQRAYKLAQLIKEQEGILQIMKGRKIGSIDEFHAMFQEVLDSNAEGIVLKKQNSTYKPGVRIGGGWYKDKADYISGLTTEFDLLIIGGFYNRKRTFIDSFLLGVLKTNETARDEVFSVGSVANNTRQRSVLNNGLKPHWHDMAKEPPPIWYHYKPSTTDGNPHVWIEPQHSIILQIKAADLAPNGAFYTANSLHFARTERVRDDKVWNECMTLEEYMQLSQVQGRRGIKKINKRQLRLEDFTSARKRQKTTAASRTKLAEDVYEKHYDVQQVEPSSQLFNGFSFCILSGSLRDRNHNKQQLRTLVARNGGTVVENPLPNDPNCICIAGDKTFLVERLIQKTPRANEIVSMKWLIRACEEQQIVLRPKDVVAATATLQEQLDINFDKFGDSYADAITSIAELQEMLNDITEEQLAEEYFDASELAEMEDLLLGSATINFFRNNYAYFYNGHNEELLKLLFMQHGGICLNQDEDNESGFEKLTCIIMHDEYKFNLQSFEAWRNDHDLMSLPTVKSDWIIHSSDARRKLNVEEYLWTAMDDLSL